MTVYLYSGRQRWIGLSTDLKPDAKWIHSEFHELDSGKHFVWDGAAWTQDVTGGFLDIKTHAQTIIDYAHHEVHDGDSFTTCYIRTTDSTDAHRSGLYILTPADVEIHLIASFSASTAASFSICEGITIDLNEGTNGVAIYNRDRNSTKLSKIKDNATAHTANKITTFTEAELAGATFTAGTILRTEPLEVGAGPKPAGVSSRGTQEYILKKSTPYLFRMTNTAAAANIHHIMLDWYEHDARLV